ncbi:bidirectional sugar transporter SWEET17-like [Humulus lupulus]|uniref:bidirectional sugar transporter SWEET17-like n=1 Tax=Humulus lupulus TaxID=3486 RepID=UPI002B414AFD|nr:bidirectional sugar transporter SWEET17-like [Humulus lupulus]
MAVSLSFIIGIIGNIISILVFTSPIKTFWGVLKVKSTENYQGLPYITTLLSTSLWTFYGILNPDGLLIMTVNGAGAIFQLIYVTIFLIYAPMDKKVKTGKLFAILDVGFFGSVIVLTLFAIREELKLTFVGILCSALTIAMYASPLTVMGLVIRMKSVDYMPFFLSFFLFLNAGIWSIYAVLVKDYFIGIPNAIGFVLGCAQLILYSMYKNKSKKPIEILEEEGSATLVKERAIEMQEHGVGAKVVDLKNKNLSKGVSLPKPLIKRLYSMPTKIMKTISLNSYDLDSAWALGIVEDIEAAEKKSALV